MISPRIVLCEACGSEGRILRAEYSTDPNPRDCGPCPYCKGTGGEIIETQPIEMEDLEEMAGGEPDTYVEGQMAFIVGHPAESNPYSPETYEHRQCAVGWRFALAAMLEDTAGEP